MKLTDLAERLNCRLEGSGDVEISGINSLERAGPTQLSFLANRKYTPLLKTTRAGAVLLSEEFGPSNIPALRCDDPYLKFAKAIEIFYQPPKPAIGVHPTAVLAASARIGPEPSPGT